MATKWKTIMVMHDFEPIDQESNNAIISQIAAWRDQGRYTGGAEIGPVPGSPNNFMWHRWWWDSEKSARDYVDFMRQFYGKKEITIDIGSEELPD